MDLNANARIKIIPNKATHIIKQIPTGGEILVKQGTEVKASDFIGRFRQTAGFRSINAPQELNVSPKDIAKYLMREVGKTIYKGELLAEKKELLGKKEIKAPTDAVINSIDPNTGIIMLRLLPKEVPVLSGVNGVVDFIDAQTGNIYIKTLVTQINGALGSGKQQGGILKIIGNQRSFTLDSLIPENVHQTIILGGALIYIETIRKALANGAVGIISGGINARDYKSLIGLNGFHLGYGNDIGISVLIEHGFGGLALSEDSYRLLWENEGKFIYMDGNNRRILLPSSETDSILRVRQVMLPILQQGAIEPQENKVGLLSVGTKVRSIWPPFMGSEGKIISIDQSPTLLESGMATYLVTVEIAGQKIKVPYSNIEIVL